MASRVAMGLLGGKVKNHLLSARVFVTLFSSLTTPRVFISQYINMESHFTSLS